MVIDVSSIQDAKGESLVIDMKSAMEDLDLGRSVFRFSGPVSIRGSATNTGSGILVQAEVFAPGMAICDRCLADFPLVVKSSFIQSYSRSLPATMSKGKRGGQADLDEDEVQTYHGESIDLSSQVIEAIMLAMPIRILCGQECRGLCTSCGADLNRGTCACGDQVQ